MVDHLIYLFFVQFYIRFCFIYYYPFITITIHSMGIFKREA